MRVTLMAADAVTKAARLRPTEWLLSLDGASTLPDDAPPIADGAVVYLVRGNFNVLVTLPPDNWLTLLDLAARGRHPKVPMVVKEDLHRDLPTDTIPARPTNQFASVVLLALANRRCPGGYTNADALAASAQRLVSNFDALCPLLTCYQRDKQFLLNESSDIMDLTSDVPLRFEPRLRLHMHLRQNLPGFGEVKHELPLYHTANENGVWVPSGGLLALKRALQRLTGVAQSRQELRLGRFVLKKAPDLSAQYMRAIRDQFSRSPGSERLPLVLELIEMGTPPVVADASKFLAAAEIFGIRSAKDWNRRFTTAFYASLPSPPIWLEGWQWLTMEQREAAKTLGYDEGRWTAELMTEQPEAKRWTVGTPPWRKTAAEKAAAEKEEAAAEKAKAEAGRMMEEGRGATQKLVALMLQGIPVEVLQTLSAEDVRGMIERQAGLAAGSLSMHTSTIFAELARIVDSLANEEEEEDTAIEGTLVPCHGQPPPQVEETPDLFSPGASPDLLLADTDDGDSEGTDELADV